MYLKQQRSGPFEKATHVQFPVNGKLKLASRDSTPGFQQTCPLTYMHRYSVMNTHN